MTGIFGWGNPIFGDDALGIKTAKKLNEMRLPQDVTVQWSSSSPFSIAGKFLNHDKVVVIDVCQDPEKDEGELFKWKFSSLETDDTMSTPHSASLFSVLNLYKELYPENFPKEILFYGMYVNTLNLTEKPSETLRRNSEKLAQLIFEDIRREKCG